jgi:hypothetical protein
VRLRGLDGVTDEILVTAIAQILKKIGRLIPGTPTAA